MARVRCQVQDKTKFCLWNPLRPTSSPTSTSHLPLLPFFPTLVSTPHRAGEGLSEDGSVLPKCVYLIASSKWGCTWSSGVTQEVPATPGLAHRCQGLWDWHLGLLGKSPKKLLKPLSVCPHTAMQCGRGDRYLQVHFADEEKRLIRLNHLPQTPQVAQNPGILTPPPVLFPLHSTISLDLSGDSETWWSKIPSP